MSDLYSAAIAIELSIRPAQVSATAQLLAEGGTVPFIARYRKEATGSLDEVQITSVRDRLTQLAELDARRSAILKSLDERKLLTEDLQSKINTALTMSTLEDIYQPYRPKRRTRAMIAKEKGLEPLADLLFSQLPATNPDLEAAKYLTPEGSSVADDLKIPDTASALQGARDILAERISDHADTRAKIRHLFLTQGTLKSEVIAGKEAEAAKFKDYFNWSEPLRTAPSHRLLAIRRGAAEGFLFFSIQPLPEDAIAILESEFVKSDNPSSDQVRLAVKDSYKRLLSLSMETEARLASKQKADAEAIQVFTSNLRQLLLASPLGQKRILAIDPGFRTGCKIVALDPQGQLLENTVIYPDQGASKTQEATETLKHLITKHDIQAIAIGNGTAGRETESFVRKLLQSPPTAVGGSPLSTIPIVMVNESGASIYSASDVAREEFPDHDLTVRGAISIGRRLLDPLAELVKLDPKSIGVGQYQHDVDQDSLKKSLDDTVTSCVNAVGVNLNTASKQLLTYVAGLNPALAQNIISHRNTHGPFTSRQQLLAVPRLGEKTFEQAAGFLRIPSAENPLDSSAVHPETYPLVNQMAQDLNVTIKSLISDESLRKQINKQRYITPTVGLPTLTDILAELAKPGLDPRQTFQPFSFTDGVTEISHLKPGMKLPGLITNVTAFGAFVDIGVHQDGLIHISQLSDRFVKDPSEIVKVQQQVEVTILEVDLPRKRIALTLKKGPTPTQQKPAQPRTTPVASTPRPNTQPTPKPQPKRPAPAVGGWFTDALKDAKRK
ncbi:MAG TPA: Tex family protein [Tepidisphaeraceae bacterium]|jgi:uncharacterized protein|nr:Tex family protein [Tepidisphaeraceae bacterium]